MCLNGRRHVPSFARRILFHCLCLVSLCLTLVRQDLCCFSDGSVSFGHANPDYAAIFQTHKLFASASQNDFLVIGYVNLRFSDHVLDKSLHIHSSACWLPVWCLETASTAIWPSTHLSSVSMLALSLSSFVNSIADFLNVKFCFAHWKAESAKRIWGSCRGCIGFANVVQLLPSGFGTVQVAKHLTSP